MEEGAIRAGVATWSREEGTWTEGAPRSSGVTMRGGRRAEQGPGGGRYLKHRPPLGALLPVRSRTSGSDGALTLVSDWFVLVPRQAAPQGVDFRGELVGECAPAVEYPGNLAGALALRSGMENMVSANGDSDEEVGGHRPQHAPEALVAVLACRARRSTIASHPPCPWPLPPVRSEPVSSRGHGRRGPGRKGRQSWGRCGAPA